MLVMVVLLTAGEGCGIKGLYEYFSVETDRLVIITVKTYNKIGRNCRNGCLLDKKFQNK